MQPRLGREQKVGRSHVLEPGSVSEDLGVANSLGRGLHLLPGLSVVLFLHHIANTSAHVPSKGRSATMCVWYSVFNQAEPSSGELHRPAGRWGTELGRTSAMSDPTERPTIVVMRVQRLVSVSVSLNQQKLEMPSMWFDPVGNDLGSEA